MMNKTQIERARRGTAAPDMSQLYAALAKAQGEFPSIPKTKQGHGYKYAPLEAVQKAVRPVLAAHGLCFFQHIRGHDMITVIAHESGAIMETAFPMRAVANKSMNPMQALGAVSTYAARYGLCLALGISADEDTDCGDSVKGVARVTEDFTDPDHDDMNISVRGVEVPPDASPRQKAEIYAETIEKLFEGAKTETGLTGAWRRNQRIIDRLGESHEDLYENILDVYNARLKVLRED